MIQKRRYVLGGWLMGAMWCLNLSVAAEESACGVASVSQPDGLTIIVTMDLSKLQCDPANGGTWRLPGTETAKTPWGSLPCKRLEIIVPAGMALVGWDSRPEGETLPGVTLSLAPSSMPCEDHPPVVPNEPTDLVKLDAIETQHGIRVARFSVAPVQVYPQTGSVRILKTLTLRVKWGPLSHEASVAMPAALNLEAARARQDLQKRAVNGDALDATTATTAPSRAIALGGAAPATYAPSTPTGTVEGVIICPAVSASLVRPYADEKTRAGHPWEVVTYEWIYAQPAYQQGIFTDQPARIRAFLQEAYARFGLTEVLFLGAPPMVRAVWDRVTYGDFAYHDHVTSYPSLGYYTNLDGGDHTDLTIQGLKRVRYARIHDPDQFPGVSSVTFRDDVSAVDQIVPGLARCGYNMYYQKFSPGLRFVLPAGVQISVPTNRLSLNTQYFTTINLDNPSIWAEPFARQHPELWGQEVVFFEKAELDHASTCDLTPELRAGILPSDGFGAWPSLYQAKVRRYREPVDPLRSVLLPWASPPPADQDFSTFLEAYAAVGLSMVMKAAAPGGDLLLKQGEEVAKGALFALQDGSCSGGSLLKFFQSTFFGLNGIHNSMRIAIQPAGLIGLYGCQVNKPYGEELVERPDDGPVVFVRDGLYASGGYHEGPGVNGPVPERLRNRPPLSQIALEADGPRAGIAVVATWQANHSVLVYGDPSIRMWGAPPERVQIALPETIGETVAITLRDAAGQPLAEALVVLSKRRPDGSYALYQRQTTDAGGQAVFAIGPVAALGSGVVNVEIDSYPPTPFHDYYPYHGVIALLGNTPPNVGTPTSLTVPQTTQEGSWVLLTAGDMVDPDGDPVTITWSWTDVRTGEAVARQATGQAVRVFLPSGISTITVTASDGVSSSSTSWTVTVVSPDANAPMVRPGTPIFVSPVERWVDIPVMVNPPNTQGTLMLGPWTLTFKVSDAGGAGVSGIREWAIAGVSDGTIFSSTTSSLVSPTLVQVWAAPQADGSLRQYGVTLRAWDFSGNVGEGVGFIVIQDRTPPQVVTRPPVMISASGAWVTIPVRVVAPGVGVPSGSLAWEAFDPPGYPGGPNGPILGWTLTAVDVTDPTRPQPLTYALEGTTLRVLAESNSDFTVRQYTVTVQMWDGSGNSATARNSVVVAPSASTTLAGRVMNGPLPGVGYLVELQTVSNPSRIIRAFTDANGFWMTYGKTMNLSYHVRVSRGGQTFRYTYNQRVPVTSSTGVTLAGGYLDSRVEFPLIATAEPAPQPNRAPVAKGPCLPLVTFYVLANQPITLDGLKSFDPDGDLLTHTWTWTAGGASHVRQGPVVSGSFPEGTTLVTLTVSDGILEASTTVTVRASSRFVLQE